MDDQELHDNIMSIINSMTEDERKLVLTMMIFYISEHPEILTDTTRKAMENLESTFS